MTSKQIHELTEAGVIAMSDLLALSVTGNLTRKKAVGDLPYQRKGADQPLVTYAWAAAPGTPSAGDVVGADGNPSGSGWNPGLDQGLYRYDGASWRKLVDSSMQGWIVVHPQTGTSYTLDVAGGENDLGHEVECTNAGAVTVTVPQLASVPGASGTKPPGSTSIVVNRKVYCETLITQGGAGAVTAAAGSGVSFEAGSTLSTAGQGQSLLVRWLSATLVRVRLLG